MPDKIKCFISYNHSDADRDTLDLLREWLESAGNSHLDILFDKNLEYGNDITKFMELISKVNGILIIFTPGYKQKILNRNGGVYDEYKLIYSRLKTIEERKRKSGDFDDKDNCIFLPVLFSGDINSSIPDEFLTKKFLDLRSLRVRKDDNKFIVAKQDERKYKKEVVRLVSQLFAISCFNSNDYKKQYEKVYSILFGQLKADWTAYTEEEMQRQDHLFVKTHAYKKVKDQSSYLLVGRKGSGKSTVTIFLGNKNIGYYKEPIPIIVDDFELEFMFGMFDIPAFSSDTKNVVTVTKAFSFVWELFIYVCCMEVLITEYKKGKVSEIQENGMKVITEKINVIKNQENTLWRKSASFSFCLHNMKEFINHCIESSRNESEYFYADILNNFTLSNFKVFVFGQEVVDAFYAVTNECKRKFLISMDGFDTAFDEYRVSTIQKFPYDKDIQYQRTVHEIEWLSSFLHVVLRIKSNHENINLYRNIDFCVTIPKDRFLEVRELERDSYNYERKYIDINWSGIELTILLRKRLEILGCYYTEKHLPVEDRLDDILAEKFSCIPTYIETDVSSRTYKVHIFLYVLRHTFWRPRDILFYFATIIAVSNNLRKKNKKVTNEIIKKLVSETTFKVIKTEFINEFKTSLTNIEDIIFKFHKSKQIITFSEISNKLSTVSFIFAGKVNETWDINDKIMYLYEIGFLGINANEKILKRFSLRMKHAFYFNEGDSLLEGDGEGNEKYSEYEFIIHPIFCEYLNLNTKNQSLTLNYTWDYLQEGDAFFV